MGTNGIYHDAVVVPPSDLRARTSNHGTEMEDDKHDHDIQDPNSKYRRTGTWTMDNASSSP